MQSPVEIPRILGTTEAAQALVDLYVDGVSPQQQLLLLERQALVMMVLRSLNEYGWEGARTVPDSEGDYVCVEFFSNNPNCPPHRVQNGKDEVAGAIFAFIDRLDFRSHSAFLEKLSKPLVRNAMGQRLGELFPSDIASHMQKIWIDSLTHTSLPAPARPRL